MGSGVSWMQIQIMFQHRTEEHCPRSIFRQIMLTVKSYRHLIEKCHQTTYTLELDRPDCSSSEIIVAISKIVGTKECFFAATVILMDVKGTSWINNAKAPIEKTLKVKNETIADWELESPILAPWFYNNETTYPGDWFPKTKVSCEAKQPLYLIIFLSGALANSKSVDSKPKWEQIWKAHKWFWKIFMMVTGWIMTLMLLCLSKLISMDISIRSSCLELVLSMLVVAHIMVN